MSLTGTELQTRIDTAKTIVDQFDVAILALADMTIREYVLDTGQGIQTVRRTDLLKLVAARDALLESYNSLCNRQTGDNVTHALPAY